MCILPIHSNSHSSPQNVDRDIQTKPFERYSRASQESVIKSASHLTVFSQSVSNLKHVYIAHTFKQP